MTGGKQGLDEQGQAGESQPWCLCCSAPPAAARQLPADSEEGSAQARRSSPVHVSAGRIVAARTIAPPFAIAYRRLATSVSDQIGGREGLEGLGGGDGEGDGGMVEPGDLGDPQVKVG